MGSFGFKSSGFLRKVKKPTANGMRMRIMEKHNIAKPATGDIVPLFSTPLTVVVYGILPVAATAPNTHKNKPQQPQVKAVPIVAMIPT